MPTEQPCPKDSPLMIEWEKYRQTEDFKNSFKWAADVLHRTGSMWAAFAAGALAMKPDASASLHRTEPQTAPDTSKFENLADAMWQLLDDMGEGLSVCEESKQEAIAAFAPFANPGRIRSAAPADAERLALAEKIDKFSRWPAGHYNPTGYLQSEDLALIVSSLRAGGWREDMQS